MKTVCHCHSKAIAFIKVDLTDNLGSLWNSSQNNISPPAACMEIGIQINNNIYLTKERN